VLLHRDNSNVARRIVSTISAPVRVLAAMLPHAANALAAPMVCIFLPNN
jgi:hypothetical protein